MGPQDQPEALDIEALAAVECLESTFAFLKKKFVLNYTEDAKGCWRHNNVVNSEGYVTLVFSFKGKQKAFKAHRLSYILFKGEIPEGKQINHTCDVRNCINPDHLYAGSPSDNNNDMYCRGRNPKALTEDDIGFIIVLHEAGYSQEKIANMLGVAQMSVSNHLRSVN